MARVAVVIPVYKQAINADEERSLQQCLKVLGKHPIVFVGPDKLNYAHYENACAAKNIVPQIIRLDNFFFESIAGYNRLLLSADFYRKFLAYDYMLLYQLDAWVFSDELELWCNKGFDYIGAPWFVGQDKSDNNSPFMENSGNGGFSLRNIKGFLKVINSHKIILPPAGVLQLYKGMNPLSVIARLPVIIARMLGYKNNVTHQRNQFALNEDNYWSFIAPKVCRHFKVAKSTEAIGFAFELQPARMFELNKRQLPFGCHAWEKYDYDFWKPYLI